MAAYDVIVIGAGIEGSSSAYNLTKKGKKVLLLEQFPLPHTRGSSHGQSRITRYVYTHEFYVHMMTHAFPMWTTLEQESGTEFFVNCGVLDFRQKGSQGLKNVARALRAHDVPHETIGAREIHTRFPAFKVTDDTVAVFDPRGGLLRADLALGAFQKVFVQMGGTLKDQCSVTSIVPGEIIKVVTPYAIFSAKSIVIAAGPWAGKFAKALDLDIPLNPIRIAVYYWKVQEDNVKLCESERMPCFIDSGDRGFHLYGLPADEYPGLVKVCLHTGPDIDPDERDKTEADWPMEVLAPQMKMFPCLAEKPSIIEQCIYTMTPDDNPYIDRHPKFPNIVIAAGFSGHGFKLAPAVGKAVSELVTGASPSFNMQPFKLDRFQPKANL